MADTHYTHSFLRFRCLSAVVIYFNRNRVSLVNLKKRRRVYEPTLEHLCDEILF